MERPSNPSSDDTVDPRPLPRNTSLNWGNDKSRRPSRLLSLRGATRFLRPASNRQIIREPSMLVRETMEKQLEERQSDQANSRPVVVLDLLWNMEFVVATAATVLVLSRDEDPLMPLRLSIEGNAWQCLLHMVSVCVEYGCRHRQVQGELMEDGSGRTSRISETMGFGPREENVATVGALPSPTTV